MYFFSFFLLVLDKSNRTVEKLGGSPRTGPAGLGLGTGTVSRQGFPTDPVNDDLQTSDWLCQIS